MYMTSLLTTFSLMSSLLRVPSREWPLFCDGRMVTMRHPKREVSMFLRNVNIYQYHLQHILVFV